ncbi:hypothetical protein [Corynebacterium sp. HMSC28B08]|uniref:hypothetical protein n=1 Tax=Corynebacterium TaxID=1716 RepID=UPI0008A2D053|nr:hypothetical protein [Corynebacterium sp. HMSC28B08]OFT91599.1 hypothetical protein HMPREF3098_00615 [Corynebacterium sp. HMSC28B08]
MSKKYAFTLALSAFYAICTAMTAGTQLVESITTNKGRLVINILLLIAVFIVSTVLVAMFQRKRAPVELNSVAIVCFTVIYTVVILLSELPLTMLLFPACMFAAFIAVPSYQKWLKATDVGLQ